MEGPGWEGAAGTPTCATGTAVGGVVHMAGGTGRCQGIPPRIAPPAKGPEDSSDTG